MSNFSAKLIHWQKHHGRHHLPWQGTRDPYAIWLSEIMLQQTQVTTVTPYYQRFMLRFPNINSLSLGPLDDILTLWSGLGYYARARYLHQTAQLIMKNYGGKFPRQLDLIQQFPGIGRSTAAAIAVFAFGERCAILDGNVKRVLTRYFGIEGYPGNQKIQNQLWEKAITLLPDENAKDNIETYTQALMDLGALVCTRSKPNCTICPLQQDCTAFRENRVNRLPTIKPRRALPEKETVFLILTKQKKILLEKRPAPGIWGGLWCPPEMTTNKDATTYCSQHYNLTIIPLNDMPPLNHSFTHFKLRIHPKLLGVISQINSKQNKAMWLTLDEALATAIPTPVRKLLKQIESNPIFTSKNG
jgi:A/G-specific adenine glycosylase